MAAGNVFTVGPTNVANNGFLDAQPSSGVEVAINNWAYSGAVELYFTDGTLTVGPLDSDLGAGSRGGRIWRCTNSKFYRLKNVSGGSQAMSVDGIQTA